MISDLTGILRAQFGDEFVVYGSTYWVGQFTTDEWMTVTGTLAGTRRERGIISGLLLILILILLLLLLLLVLLLLLLLLLLLSRALKGHRVIVKIHHTHYPIHTQRPRIVAGSAGLRPQVWNRGEYESQKSQNRLCQGERGDIHLVGGGADGMAV